MKVISSIEKFPFAVSMTNSLIKKIDSRAKKEGLTRSKLVTTVMENYLSRKGSVMINKVAKEMGRATENAYDEIMNYENIYTPIYNKSVALSEKYSRDRAIAVLSRYIRGYYPARNVSTRQIAEIMIDEANEFRNSKQSNRKRAEIGDPLRERNLRKVWNKSDHFNRQKLVDEAELKDYSEFSYLPTHTIADFDFEDFPEDLRSKYSSRKRQAGGGAGIKFKVSKVYGIADIDLVNEVIKSVDTEPIDSFDAEGYQDGMNDVKGSLVIPEISFSDEDKNSIVKIALEVLSREYDLQEIKELYDFEDTESYIEIRGFNFEGMIFRGYTRGKLGTGDAIELQGTAEIELHFNGDYFSLGEFDAELSLTGTEDFGYFYQDVFRFDGEGSWTEDDWYFWQEDLKSNYGV